MDGFERDKAIGAKSIAPLVRLGLLEPDPAAPGHLTVSARGRATWDHFLQAGGQFPEDDLPSLIATSDPDTVHRSRVVRTSGYERSREATVLSCPFYVVTPINERNVFTL